MCGECKGKKLHTYADVYNEIFAEYLQRSSTLKRTIHKKLTSKRLCLRMRNNYVRHLKKMVVTHSILCNEYGLQSFMDKVYKQSESKVYNTATMLQRNIGPWLWRPDGRIHQNMRKKYEIFATQIVENSKVA